MHYSDGSMNSNKNSNNKLGISTQVKYCLTAAIFFLSSGVLHAETAYVTDMLQLELYETMEQTGRPLKRLRSGDSMEILQREGRIARVRLKDGETGWVKSLYLVDKEPARTRVNKLEKETAAASETIAALEKKLGDRDAQLQSLQASQEGSLDTEQVIQAELEDLRIQNADMQSRLNAYVGNVPMSWLFVALIVALGLGFFGGWYFIDRRSRARHGGYRIY